MRVAVLGTGIMGGPMARTLLRAGHDVAVWNRTPARAEPLAADGARVARAAGEAVEGAEAILTMVADGPAVDQTMRAALPGVARGSLWLQTSTVGVDWTERLVALAETHGIAYVDAPVLGSKPHAEAGELIVLASGTDAALERCEPLFAALGSRTLRLGEAGQATRLKLVVNSFIFCVVGSVAETVVLARALEVDPRRFLETIAGEFLDSAYVQRKGKLMLDESFEASFPLALAHKDARLALEAAAVELPVLEVVARQQQRAIELGHGNEDTAAVIHASRRS